MIVIISNKFDFAVDYVVRELSKRGEEMVRVNSEDLITYPVVASFPDFNYRIHHQGLMKDISQRLKSVWFRRPGKPFEWVPTEEKPPLHVRGFIEDQWHSFLEGLLSIPNVLWVNHISRNQDAECKIIQLKAAQKVGFSLPRTCITSDINTARDFFNFIDSEVVVKALYAPLIEYESNDFFIFTKKIEFEDLDADSLKLAPCIFQEFISPKVEYRVTVVNRKVMTVRVKPTLESEYVDWRKEKVEIEFSECKLPPKINQMCINLLSELGLFFGAIDLVQKDGEFFFLEINPNGEWAWLQEDTGLDIASSIASTLSRGLENL